MAGDEKAVVAPPIAKPSCPFPELSTTSPGCPRQPGSSKRHSAVCAVPLRQTSSTCQKSKPRPLPSVRVRRIRKREWAASEGRFQLGSMISPGAPFPDHRSSSIHLPESARYSRTRSSRRSGRSEKRSLPRRIHRVSPRSEAFVRSVTGESTLTRSSLRAREEGGELAVWPPTPARPPSENTCHAPRPESNPSHEASPRGRAGAASEIVTSSTCQ